VGVLTTRHDGDPRISISHSHLPFPFQVGAILRTGNVEAVTVSGSNSLCTSYRVVTLTCWAIMGGDSESSDGVVKKREKKHRSSSSRRKERSSRDRDEMGKKERSSRDRDDAGKKERSSRGREDTDTTERDHRKRSKKDRSDDDESEDEGKRRDDDRKRSRRKKRSSKSHSKKRRKRDASPSSSSSSSESDSDSSVDRKDAKKKSEKAINARLIEKLAARGETLEERRERRAQKRAAHIADKFGYTPDANPFNDPNLHEAFTWKKREEKLPEEEKKKVAKKQDNTFEEIEKVRQRRKDRDAQFEEMERIRAEESRMKELENYDDWARKEEEFHLQQQRQRSAIRLVEGREKPVDILAKNMLLFGLTEEEKKNRAAVKYKERYSALEALENLEAELEEPHDLLKMLKLNELEELLIDIDAFRSLEREASVSVGATSLHDGSNPVLRYWDALRVVAEDEVKFLKSGGAKGAHAKIVEDVQKIFEGQSVSDLNKMKDEIGVKLRQNAATQAGEAFDRKYWLSVAEQLTVCLAKAELSDLHSKMLVRQLEKLEKKKEELADQPADAEDNAAAQESSTLTKDPNMPKDVSPGFGDLEEELGLTSEVGLTAGNYTWQDKYRPRKPRYFNRVRAGYDWNKYNQTHYDFDNPPPKIVQGYKFNVFYPDLIDPTKTPQFFLEPADSDEFCIIRFHAGPPYEDIAFKIINREWNRSRKRGFKCTFERGVLSLYFGFMTHWYRR
jgi:hypothetical protein